MSDLMSNTAVALEEEDTMHGKYLALCLDDQQFGIAIDYVVDIIQVQPITRVPNCPDFIKGITNLRGKVIPIVDLRIRFGKSTKDYTERTCIIVLEDDGSSVGMIVDSVSVVLDLEDEQISPPPSFSQGIETKFISGVGKGGDGDVTLILDCKTVLDDMRGGGEDLDDEEF